MLRALVQLCSRHHDRTEIRDGDYVLTYQRDPSCAQFRLVDETDSPYDQLYFDTVEECHSGCAWLIRDDDLTVVLDGLDDDAPIVYETLQAIERVL